MSDLTMLNTQHALVGQLAQLKASVDEAQRGVEKAESRLAAVQAEYDTARDALQDDVRACLKELLAVFPEDRAVLRDLSL